MLIIFFRVLILYILVVIVVRIMGKRQLGEIQPFELVITIMIADLASSPLEDISVPLLNGIIPILTLLVMQGLISILLLKYEKVRKIICGKPSFIIKNGKLLEKELKRLRININDFSEQLRSNGYPKVHEVSYVIIETNGKMSIIPKDIKTLPITLIADGKRHINNLNDAQLTEEWLNSQLQKKGIYDDKEIFWAYIDGKKLYIYRKEDIK